MSRSQTSAFTLLEVLISIMIFSVVSIALIGILSGAVRIFRAGETARAAHDESVAAIAQLDDDLTRMVPPGDGGFLYLRVRDTDPDAPSMQADPSKNMLLAFKIRNPDPRTVSNEVTTSPTADAEGMGAHLIVCWFVDQAGWLNRTTEIASDSDGSNAAGKELDKAAIALQKQGRISKDCLYFGADLSLDQPAVVGGPSTRTKLTWDNALPTGTTKYCTEANTNYTAQPFPRGIRISMTLTGGSRNRLVGRFVSEDASGIRITGVTQVPAGAGALARITSANGSEWIQYDTATNGILSLGGVRPAPVRRTNVILHARGDAVEFGTTYSIVRTIPR